MCYTYKNTWRNKMAHAQHSEIIQDFFAFWNDLDTDTHELILSNMYEVQYQKGETIHHGSNDCIGVLLIINGRLRTYILSEDGREVTLYRLNRGEVCVLSSSCILNYINFDVHIDADIDSTLLIINSEIFAHLVSKNILFENYSNSEAVKRFSDVMWAMQQVLFMSFDKRLASFLLDELARNDDGKIAMTHEQIAKYVGSARAVVSRMLKYFANEGLVELYRGGIRVTKPEKLKEILASKR